MSIKPLADTWEERRDGWHSQDGYTITIHGAHGRYAALAPDGSTIKMNLGSFAKALSCVNLHRGGGS